MSTFTEICQDAEKTRFSVYRWAVPITIPAQFTEDNKERKYEKILRTRYTEDSKEKLAEQDNNQLKELRTAERKERCQQLREIFAKVGEEACEEADATIAKLIPPPVHITEAPADQLITLLQRGNREEETA